MESGWKEKSEILKRSVENERGDRKRIEKKKK
jgi:hypothetical protein